MREFRAIVGGLALIATLYAADTIGSAALRACEQRVVPAYQLSAACALTIAVGFAAYAIERRRRSRGRRAWNWYLYAVGAIALGTLGAALHANAVRDVAHDLFNAMFFVIAAPVLRRWWQSARRLVRPDRVMF
ncbi:MAG: hypothetical protein NVSMB5_16360 [Candidatus Velthaea sp.]